jgi:site-specific recombinase XerD
MDITNLCQQFCEYSAYIRGYAPDTIRRYRTTVHLLRARTGITEIEECTEDRVREFFYRGRAERHWAANSFVTFHKSLAVFFRWCVEQGHLGVNPTDRIEVPRPPKRLPPRLSRQEAMRLLEVVLNYPWPYTFLRYRNHAILATFLFSGLRKSELLRLQLNDLDLTNQSLLVRQGKGSKDRVVPVSSTLAAILRRYLEERARLRKTCPEVFASLNRDMGLTEQGLKHLVVDAKRITGLQFHIHTLRHTFATLMLEGGCDIFSLSKMMGHSDIKTTTIYLAASTAHLRAQMIKHPLNWAKG